MNKFYYYGEKGVDGRYSYEPACASSGRKLTSLISVKRHYRYRRFDQHIAKDAPGEGFLLVIAARKAGGRWWGAHNIVAK